MAAKGIRKNKKKTQITWKEINRQKVLIFWAAVFVIYGFIFCYLPLGGWLMAFQNYKPKDGLLHSQFVGLAKFQQLFSDATFLRVIRNTLAMGIINLVFTFVMAIVFAILLNEVRSRSGKKVVQTISYLPHFLSWIIVTGILHDALSGTGIVNELLLKFHILDQPLNFFAYPKYFWWIVAFANVWKETGWNAIIYLSAITAIDPSLYEAASIDGCGSFRTLVRILMPLCKPALVSVGLFNFIWTWNAFMDPLIYISSVKKYPLSLALRMTLDLGSAAAWNEIFAMSVLSILPPVLLFFAGQKYFIQGISTSGLKG